MTAMPGGDRPVAALPDIDARVDLHPRLARPSGTAGLVLLLALSLASCAPSPADRPVHLFVAASLQEAVGEIGAGLAPDAAQAADGADGEPPIEVRLNVASSGVLRRQIERSDRADLFFSASTEEMQRLIDAGRVDPSQVLEPLSNALVLIAADAGEGPACDPDPSACLRAAARLAIGNPDSVPAGRYARQWLEALGAWSDLEDRLLPTPDVRAALAAVRSGGAPLGVVYATDAALFPELVVVHRVPPETPGAPEIRYALAPVRSGDDDTQGARGSRQELRHEARVRRVLDALVGPSARAVYQRHGFTVLPVSAQSPPASTSQRPLHHGDARVAAVRVRSTSPDAHATMASTRTALERRTP